MNYTKRTKEEEEKKKKVTIAYYHRLLRNTTTIEEGDNIVTVTFFVAKSLKKATTIAITIFCSKAIEEGDKNCRHLLLLYNTTIE